MLNAEQSVNTPLEGDTPHNERLGKAAEDQANALGAPDDHPIWLSVEVWRVGTSICDSTVRDSSTTTA